MPMTPDRENERLQRAENPPPALTLCVVTRTAEGQIAAELIEATGPFQRGAGAAPDLPPEWLARAIPLNPDDDQEDEPCR